jgi:type IV secretion system protein VirB4
VVKNILNLFKKKKETIFSLELQNHHLIPYACHFDHETILTKNGELMQTFKISGLAKNISQQDDLREIIRSSIAKHIQNDNFAIWIHTIRRKANLDNAHHFHSQAAQLIHDEWCYKNKWHNKLINELYVTILYQGKNFSSIKNILSCLTAHRLYKKQLQSLNSSVDIINNVVNNLINDLKDFGAEKLIITKDRKGAKSEILEFLDKIVNLHSHRAEVPLQDLSKFLSTGKVAFGNNIFEVVNKKFKRFGAILSIKDHQSLSENDLDNIIKLPQEFIISDIMILCDKKLAKQEYSNTLKYLEMNSDENEHISNFSDLNKINNNINSDNKSIFIERQLTITIISDTIDQLNDCLLKTNQKLQQLGLVTYREDMDMENIYWSNLPGNFSFIRRKTITLLEKISEFASLHNSAKGLFENEKGGAITLFKLEDNTPLFFNFFNNNSAHTLISGPAKSDRTIITNFLLSESTKFTPFILGIESQYKSKILIDALGGEYFIISLDKENYLNPLQLADTKENRLFIIRWLEIITDIQIDNNDAEDILKKLFITDYEQRTISNAKSFIQNKEIIKQLLDWQKGNIYGYIFDNQDKINNAQYQILSFNIGRVLKYPKVYQAIIAYLMHLFSINQTKHQSILYIHDENSILENPKILGTTPKLWLEQLNQNDAMLLLCSINTNDSIFHKAEEELFETNILLPDDIKINNYQKLVELSDTQISQIKRMKSIFRHFMIIQNNQTYVAEFNITGLYYVLSILETNEENIRLQIKSLENGDNGWLNKYLQLHNNKLLEEYGE